MPKTAKTIFNTTEKSNFILNMKPEEYHGYNLKILLGFLILMPLFCIPLEFANVYSVPTMALSITGVVAIVFVLIGFMKSETPKNLFLPAGILGAMLIWGLVSLFNAPYIGLSLFGEDGRGEGWLASLFYAGFFLLGAQLGTDQNRLKLINGMLWMGLAECLWSFLQILPVHFPSYYQNLEPVLLFDLFLPSGLTGSPIFLTILLSMLLIPAMLGEIFSEKKSQKIFYWICSVCFVIVSVKTQCLLGICAPIAAILIAAIYGITKKSGKSAIFSLVTTLLAFAVGLGLSYIAPSINHSYSRATGENVQIENQFVLYDGAIIWEDSSYRLIASGYYIPNGAENPNGSFEISSIPETYQFLNKGTANIIRLFPLTGSGQDSMAYVQRYQDADIASNPNTFDRCYNYYLHLAGTTGIPMLILFIFLMGLVIIRGISACRKSGNWMHFGILSTVILYLLMMFLGTSCITVAPLFWMFAGICVNLKQAE
ncbi:MAG: O-antigen ligase family protein [Oscillospiraceae bacterium]|nr:O-antigen ligase family protein [Oscillospiraceae bacterium]